MAVTDTPLASEERTAIIERLREFGEQQRESQQIADRSSLERATDLTQLYGDKSWWMEKLPAPPKRRRSRGRPEQPDSFNRFIKWAEPEIGLKRSRLKQLRQADRITATAVAINRDVGERAIRPLNWLLNNRDYGAQYADRVGEVYALACERAETDNPGQADVRAALREWKKANGLMPDRESKAPEDRSRVKRERDRLRQFKVEAERLMDEHPKAFGRIMEQLEARRDQILVREQ